MRDIWLFFLDPANGIFEVVDGELWAALSNYAPGYN